MPNRPNSDFDGYEEDLLELHEKLSQTPPPSLCEAWQDAMREDLDDDDFCDDCDDLGQNDFTEEAAGYAEGLDDDDGPSRSILNRRPSNPRGFGY